ncbi:MAG TPA: GDP-mannose 4,6-dehydratase, partial [Fibrobacteraceae bacterium]|nr:GDP-mannose 4,6-dehydratase [Fibrobacteraceae bacterium]
ELLVRKGYRVLGLIRESSMEHLQNLEYLGIRDKIELIHYNVGNIFNIIYLMEKYKPDEFYNLVAQSSVGVSFAQPQKTIELNVSSVLNILESIRSVSPTTKFYQASSSEMFGLVRKESLPVTEDFQFHPVSPYGISKATGHWITVNYREAYGLYTVCGILFNHESALRGKNYVIKKIIETALKIKQGKASELRLGNLAVWRDWGYAPKYVEAMWLMLQQETPRDMLICSGEAQKLETFAQKVFEKLDLDYKRHLVIDEKLLRPVDLEVIYGSNEIAKKHLGWDYDISSDGLIQKLIDDEIAFSAWTKKQLSDQL